MAEGHRHRTGSPPPPGGLVLQVAPAGAVVAERTFVAAGEPPSPNAASESGRRCAHVALAALGCPTGSIPRGPRGQPLWPLGVVGSISHCNTWHAACVALTRDVAALGIDVEQHRPFPSAGAARIFGVAEHARLSELDAMWPGRHWATIAFSAKESVYKAWFPHFGTWLGFRDVDVTLAPSGADQGALDARLVRPVHGVRPGDPGTHFEGRFVLTDGHVATSAFCLRSE